MGEPRDRVDPLTKQVIHRRPLQRKPSRWRRFWNVFWDVVGDVLRDGWP